MNNSLKANILFIIPNAIKIYFSNIDKFFIYMLFPVFGQILGLFLAFCFPLSFASKIITKTSSISLALLMVLLLAIPGLLIFAKAFWDYMIAYIALNSMTEGAVTTGKVYDIPSHNKVATNQFLKYIGFLIILSFLLTLATSIFFIVPGAILWIYFILVFQVFTFEQNLSIKEIYKKSFYLIKGNWFQTCLLMMILVFFSIFIITMGVTVVFDYLNISSKFQSSFDFIGNSLPLKQINEYLVIFKIPELSVKTISSWLYFTLISFIVAGLTLPIRSISYSLWYKALSDKYEEKMKVSCKPAKTTKRNRKKIEDK